MKDLIPRLPRTLTQGPFWSQRSRVWGGMLVLVCLLGIFFRVVHVDRAVYWVDEVATSIRIEGYTIAEVTDQLATGDRLSIADLRYFQQTPSQRPWTDTWRALRQSPEHAPLYFVLARCWTQLWGHSIANLRSFSVVLGLLTLPAMYWLCQGLFQGQFQGRSLPVSWMAVSLLAIAPFFVAYGQEARPYSLWLLLLLLHGCFVRAWMTRRWTFWLMYSVVLILSLYTSLLTSLVMVGQGLFVGGQWIGTLQHKTIGQRGNGRVSRQAFPYSVPRPFLGYAGATGLALLGFLPWLIVILHHWTLLHDNTTWMREPLSAWAMPAIWLYNVTIVILDVPVAITPSLYTGLTLTVATAVFLLVGYAFWTLWQRAPKPVGPYMGMTALATPCLLILADVVRGGQGSTAARYFIPFQVGSMVAIAYLLADRSGWRLGAAPPSVRTATGRWRGITAGVLSICIMSCLFHWQMPPKYQKSRSLHNRAIAAIITQAAAQRPIHILAEASQVLDLISLSYDLPPDGTVTLFPPPAPSSASAARSSRSMAGAIAMSEALFLFNPSPPFRQDIVQGLEGTSTGQRPFDLVERYQPNLLVPGERVLSLWHVQ